MSFHVYKHVTIQTQCFAWQKIRVMLPARGGDIS